MTAVGTGAAIDARPIFLADHRDGSRPRVYMCSKTDCQRYYYCSHSFGGGWPFRVMNAGLAAAAAAAAGGRGALFLWTPRTRKKSNSFTMIIKAVVCGFF